MDGEVRLDDGQERRREPRVELHVDLLYDTYSSFVQAAAGNISRSGMFIAVAEPAPVGTLVSFEARLRDGKSLIRGEGEVIRVRDRARDPALPKGMAIRFLRLTPSGRELIDRLVEHHDDGGKVRMAGVRMEAVPPPVAEPSVAAAQPGLPWSGTTAPVPKQPERAPAQAAEVRPSAPRSSRRPEGWGGVRLTEEAGAEYEFTLPPDPDPEAPRVKTAPNPERRVLLVLAVMAVALALLYFGPARLIGMASELGGAVFDLLRPGGESAPASTPAPAPRPDTDPRGDRPGPGGPVGLLRLGGATWCWLPVVRPPSGGAGSGGPLRSFPFG